ncbi:uncharacterized protein LOC130548839 [Triplophysa rosa]|uniref:uncharacterized protein LOC130548839 n=1 Tax=Triplophysa rosa TaxID=992332 RepID=UPI002545F322|nr:uncharacterized protein LOC130548839 [Triplophysa rosa]
MSALQNLLKNLHAFLTDSAVFSSFPVSLLLIGLEKMMEVNLSCPCGSGLNEPLIVCIFIGPFIFMFALMFVLFSPFRHVCYQCSANKGFWGRLASCLKSLVNLCICCQCSAKDKRDDWQSCFRALGRCAIPPVMWIIILLLDGDYLACCWTTWEGKYVFDIEIDRKWCEPVEQAYAGNVSDLQQEYRAFISESQVYGYIVLAVFGLVIIVTVGLFQCCKRTPPEDHVGAQGGTQDRAENLTEGTAHDAQDRAQGDAQGSAENRPKTELKPLLSSAAKEAESSA